MDKLKSSIIIVEHERLSKLSCKILSKDDFIEPNETQKERLKQLIINMDIPSQNLLFFVYAYNHSFDEVEDILNTKNAKGQILYISSYLAELIGCDGKFIEDDTLKSLSIEAMKVVDSDYINAMSKDDTKAPPYKRGRWLNGVSNRVASIIIICTLVGTLVFGANAYAGGKLFEFVIERYEKCSAFFFSSKENRQADFKFNLSINYIPDRFELEKDEALLNMQIQTYKSENGEDLIVKINTEGQKSYLNTEGIDIEEVYIDGVKLLVWEKDGYQYLLSAQNNIDYQISGNISRSELLKINSGLQIEVE